MTTDPPPELDPTPRPARRHVWDRPTLRIIGTTAIFLIFIVLGFAAYNLITDDEASGLRPGVGIDHWHATYEIWVCGEKQPDLARFDAGIHTHGEGIIHLHPFESSEEGPGAALGKFFEYGGGLLTENEMRIPDTDTAYANGDTCPDGDEASISAWVNEEPLDDFALYIPQDGDQIVISFGTTDSPSAESPSPTP